MTTPEPLRSLEGAMAALQRGAWAEAAQLARAVLQTWGPEANALMVLARVRAETGDLPGAVNLYERARAAMPTHIHVLVNLASAYRATARLHEARSTLEAALQIDQRHAIAHNNLGNVLADLGEPQAARRAYERAAALDPNYCDPQSSLAKLAEDEHRLDEARLLAERALKLVPQNVLASLTLARVNLRQDDPLQASLILERLLAGGALSITNHVIAQGYLAEAYDKLGRYSDAFAAFTQANALQRSQYTATLGRDAGPLSPNSVAAVTAFLRRADPAGWRPAPPAAAAPVFLIGFPRSGTTLLDQILASHPAISTLEERDTLIDATRELLHGAVALERWADLPERDIERLRELYWQRVTTGLSGARTPRVFVDKQPLNSVLLPLIHRIFPSAKIILAVRDPRDVVLSCYQQRFDMNVAMYQLLSLDTATAYYDTVMRLVEESRARLPLRLHVVKYEDVVTEFETATRKLLGFLELEWHEGVRGYTATARQRRIGTPSAAQVVRPLYGNARGKWRNYAGFLEPYLPTLAPWVKAFGYEP